MVYIGAHYPHRNKTRQRVSFAKLTHEIENFTLCVLVDASYFLKRLIFGVLIWNRFVESPSDI